MRSRMRGETSTSCSSRSTVCGTPSDDTTKSAEIVEPSAKRSPEARVPSTITRSTSALVWYSTPNFRPAEIKASEIAWVPPIAIAAGSNDSTSGKLWASPVARAYRRRSNRSMWLRPA